MKRTVRNTITIHGDTGHMAVNVKVYKQWPTPDGATDGMQESAWDQTCEQFWYQAQVIGEQHGYQEVFSEGRMSGWCVPTYARNSYPDPEDKREQRRFLEFQRDIMDLVENECPIWYQEAIEERLMEVADAEQIVREFCQSM